MRYLPAYLPLLAVLLFSCNGNDQQKQTNDTSADTVASVAVTPEVEHGAIQPQQRPEDGQYCYINKVYKTGDSICIDADFITFLMGREALAEARKKGDAEPFVKNGDTTWSVPNDYYIVNENKKIRTLKLSKDFRLIVAGKSDAVTDEISRFNYLRQHAEEGVFILTIGAGTSLVTVIKEQYLP